MDWNVRRKRKSPSSNDDKSTETYGPLSPSGVLPLSTPSHIVVQGSHPVSDPTVRSTTNEPNPETRLNLRLSVHCRRLPFIRLFVSPPWNFTTEICYQLNKHCSVGIPYRERGPSLRLTVHPSDPCKGKPYTIAVTGCLSLTTEIVVSRNRST